MTEPSPANDPASTRDSDLLQDSNGTGPSLANAAQQESSVFAHNNLPLRQASRRGAAPPKIHDVTEKFTKACKALNVGQLVKDEYFTLFESIGAIEIMDPKMDSGFLQPGETLEDEYDPLTPLLPEELIGIMDQLLSYEMAWHTGYPLSQTLFTSVHIDRILWPEPKTIPEAQFYRGNVPDDKRPGTLLDVLRAFCLALIKGCDFVIAKIMNRDYFEEEDFSTHTYNRVLFVQVPIDVFLRELDASIELVEDSDLEIEETLRRAILTRLQFRKDFLSALDIDVPIENLSKAWTPVQTHLTPINDSHNLGKAVPKSFSTKIPRRLASTVPPRPIVEVKFKDAMSTLKQMRTDCEEASRFVDLPTDPIEYQYFLWTFASRLPAPLPYSRACLANILFDPYILNAPVSLPLEDVKSFVFHESPMLDPVNWTLSPPMNPHLPKSPKVRFAKSMDEIVDRIGQPYLDLWVALGQNRCRLRRLLTHVVAAWDTLQSDAKLVDEELNAASLELGITDEIIENPLSLWVFIKKMWMVEKIIILGFEQEVYLPDEFAGMYHFLSTIARIRAACLAICEEHADERILAFAGSQRLLDAQYTERTARFINSELQQATGIQYLAKALQSFYTIANYLRLLPCPVRPFSTDSLRYELRMKPFLTLQPPIVPAFEHFSEELHPYGDYASPEAKFYDELKDGSSKLWSDINEALKQAKDAWSAVKDSGATFSKASGVEEAWNKEMRGMLASCVALGIHVEKLKAAVKDIETGSAEVGAKMEIPAAGKEARYVEGWVVARILEA